MGCVCVCVGVGGGQWWLVEGETVLQFLVKVIQCYMKDVTFFNM